MADRPAVGLPSARGELSLRLRPDARGRTVLVARRQRFPLRTTVPFHLDERDPAMAFVYVQNPTGGVFPGDVLEVELAAEAGARVHVTSQSATKLCRSVGGAAGVQLVSVDVGEGAYVEHVPDALIPHAGARYRQRIDVELADGGAFVALETIGPGRAGEPFSYDELDLRTTVRRGGRELCVESLRLIGPRAARGGVLGRHAWFGTLLAVAPERGGDGFAAALDSALAARTDVLAGAGALPGGCGAVARVLADRAPAARGALMAAWAAAREQLIGLPLPPLRK